MEKTDLQKRLRNCGLKSTAVRESVLQLFLNSDKALSSSDITEQLKIRFDRVTVFRTLNTFEEQGLIHSIPTEKGSSVYAVCEESCYKHHHTDNHFHFVCSNCGGIYCLNESPTISPLLPKGFRLDSFSLIIKGACSNCS